MNEKLFDCIVIGGGAAGLNAALVLGRSRRNTLIIDENQPRNRVTRESHGFLSRDGIKPEEFKKISLEQLKKYPNVRYDQDRVENVVKFAAAFEVTTKEGNVYRSKKVIFATGMKDQLPSIKGLREVYGTSVFPCPYCDGWERRDKKLAVFGNEEWLMHYVKMIYNWSKDLIVFTNGPAKITGSEKKELMEHGVQLVESPIVELQSTNGQLEKIVVKSGESFERTDGFILDTGETQASDIPFKLGVELNEMGGYKVSENRETTIEGLYIIGDAKNTFSGLIMAASEGYELGATINGEMVMEEWEHTK
ncbi:FAD-dependent oxidoreductase [Metabacillus iocasae]|uniref:Thioredoxin reductase n=1 Tax=Priestia iocasae TaxID=2291674 RepID=A0ABS2QXM2_9BACI|nr:thioredoxin reductase [Metabacillus iocasae]